MLQEAIADQLPDPAQALAAATESTDPVERVAAAARYLTRHVLTRQGVVRAMIAATVAKPELAARPGLRVGLIDAALEPLDATLGAADPAALTRLKLGLSAVVSPESLFTLTDLHGLDAEEAVAVIVDTACALTRSAIGP